MKAANFITMPLNIVFFYFSAASICLCGTETIAKLI